MGTLVVIRTVGTGASAPEPLQLGESAAELGATLPENAQVAVSGTSLSSDPLILRVDHYAEMVAELRSDKRWAELLSDASAFDLLDQMADEALAEDDAGWTLDLDDLLS